MNIEFSREFINVEEEKNLIPVKLPDMEDYLYDLRIIEDSVTGKLDNQFVNKFIYEAAQLIRNAIVLFAKGYFDCSFYSLRQSLELSTTMVYLAELKPYKRRKEIKKWSEKSEFPSFQKMIKYLEKNEGVFLNIKEEMAEFYNKIKKTKKKLNKHVHKQGLDTFYIFRRNQRYTIELKDEFLKYMKSCIGGIAFLRLAIDPLPVLLLDKEIYSRTWDTMTEVYPEKFIEVYIGAKHIENYKKTDIYNEYYKSLITKEKMLPCTTKLVKNQYIDRNKIDKIVSQSHLLSRTDIIAVSISSLSEKVTTIYVDLGLLFYFTNIESVREDSGFSSEDFMEIKELNFNINTKYGKAYLSYIKVGEEDYYIEHNKKFSQKEYDALKTISRHYS